MAPSLPDLEPLLERASRWRPWEARAGALALRLRLDPAVAAAHRELLARFLPDVARGRPERRCELSLVADSSVLDALGVGLGRLPATGVAEPVPGCRYRVVEGGGVRWLLAHPENSRPPGRVVFARAGTRVLAVVEDAAPPLPGRRLLHAVRELVVRPAENAGGAVLHAGGAVLPGGAAVAVVGDSGAGKTSTVVRLLARFRAGYLANDQLLVTPGEPPRATLVPMPVRLGRGTVEATPALDAHVAREPPCLPQDAGGAAGLPAAFAAQAKLELTPSELVAALGTRSHADAALALVLFPRLREGSGPAALRRCTPADALARLRRAVMSTENVRPWLVPWRGGSSAVASRADALCRELAARLPAVELSFGTRTDPYDLDRALGEAAATALDAAAR